MALTPSATAGIVPFGEDIEVQEQAVQTSRTYAVDWHTSRIGGYIDGIEAVRQAIYKALLTERFAYIIYSWDYGTEMTTLIGRSEDVLQSEAKRIVSEALMQDGRISDITDFMATKTDRDTMAISFTAVTIYGDAEIEQEVTV